MRRKGISMRKKEDGAKEKYGKVGEWISMRKKERGWENMKRKEGERITLRKKEREGVEKYEKEGKSEEEGGGHELFNCHLEFP